MIYTSFLFLLFLCQTNMHERISQAEETVPVICAVICAHSCGSATTNKYVCNVVLLISTEPAFIIHFSEISGKTEVQIALYFNYYLVQSQFSLYQCQNMYASAFGDFVGVFSSGSLDFSVSKCTC